jgi:hypothetical protein
VWHEQLHPRGLAGRFAHVAEHGGLSEHRRLAGAAAGGWQSAHPDRWRDHYISPALGLSGQAISLATRAPRRRLTARELSDLREAERRLTRHVLVHPHLDAAVIDRVDIDAGKLRAMAAQLEQLHTLHPARHTPIRLYIEAPARMQLGGRAAGETLQGYPEIHLNGLIFGPGHPPLVDHMPISADVSKPRYALSHEWGHVSDPTAVFYRTTDPARESFAAPLAVNVDHTRLWRKGRTDRALMSGYGADDPAEAYAEAFTEWDLTRGRTRNPLVAEYAATFGWAAP